MYLLEEAPKKINVFSFIPNEVLVTEYRRSELESNIPGNEHIYRAYSSGYKPLLKSGPFSYKNLNYEGCREGYWRPRHSFHSSGNLSDDGKKVIDKYTKGSFDGKSVIEYTDENGIVRYFIVTEQDYRGSHNSFYMDNIIQIPRSLFLLQVLIQGKYELVSDDDNIYSQLATFDLSRNPIASFDKAKLDQLFAIGIVSGEMNDLMGKVETSGPVLKRARVKSNLV